MRMVGKESIILCIIKCSIGIFIFIGITSACIVQPWESWTVCKGECGRQTQWRIRYFHLDCGNFTSKECLKICNLTHVKGNETRKCIHCSEDEWMAYYKKHIQAPPCNAKKELFPEMVALYIAIPIAAAFMMFCACCYVCTQLAKERQKRKRKIQKRVNEEKASPGIPYKKQVRVNSIDVQAQSWDW